MQGQKNSAALTFVLVLTVVPLLVLYTVAAVETFTISGTVTEYFVIKTDDGYLLGIEPNKQAAELVNEHVGRRVEVTGILTEDGAYKILRITSYRLREE